MSEAKLFSPLKVGAVTVPNRVFMAPLTRLRSIEPGDIPTPLMGEYYRQRASSGLIITEATQISAQAKGYAGAPGLHSPWIMNAVVSYLFPLLQAKLGLGPVFFIFAAINYLAILFVVFALPETSNKSLEQLEAELSANHEDKKSTRLTREVGYDR